MSRARLCSTRRLVALIKAKLILLALLPPLLTGCGFVFTKGPPTGHEQMDSFTCTESNAGPILDIVWGGLNLLAAIQMSSNPTAYGYSSSSEVVGIGVAWAGFSSLSAASGFKKSKQCHRALQQLAERNAQRRANPAGPVLPTDMPSVQAVEVSPSEHTLAVGERVQLVASAHSSSGAVIPNRDFTWSSSSDTIASISNAGLVSAHAAGTVVIAANAGNVIGRARIVVTAPR